MLDFILDNYLLVMIGGAFILFAILGFIIDSRRSDKKGNDELGSQNLDLSNMNVVPDTFVPLAETDTEQSVKEVIPAENPPVLPEEPALSPEENPKGKEVKDNK